MKIQQVAAARGRQTLAQGLITAMVMAAVVAVGSGLTAESWAEWFATWPIWTWSAFQAAGTAAVAWAVRRFADHSGIDTEEG